MDSSKGWELLRWNIDNADYDYNNYGDGDDEAEMKRGGVVLPNCGWNDRSPVRTASFLLTLSLSSGGAGQQIKWSITWGVGHQVVIVIIMMMMMTSDNISSNQLLVDSYIIAFSTNS